MALGGDTQNDMHAHIPTLIKSVDSICILYFVMSKTFSYKTEFKGCIIKYSST